MEGSLSIAIPQTSASDISVQHHKIGVITFGSALEPSPPFLFYWSGKVLTVSVGK